MNWDGKSHTNIPVVNSPKSLTPNAVQPGMNITLKDILAQLPTKMTTHISKTNMMTKVGSLIRNMPMAKPAPSHMMMRAGKPCSNTAHKSGHRYTDTTRTIL